jgi:hypothetical protein
MPTDEMKYVLYLAVNQANQKKYVGFTGRGLEHRKAQHERDAQLGKKRYFCNAIRKYGANSFRWCVVGWSADAEDIKAQEVAHLKFYKNLGEELYNMTDGGDGVTNPPLEVRAMLVANGQIRGRKNVISGQIQALGKSGIGARIGGRINVESGRAQRLGLIYGRKAFENKTGIHAPDYDRTKGGRAGGRIGNHLRWKHDGAVDSCVICKRTPDEKRVAENLALKLSRQKKHEAVGTKYNANRAQCGLSSSHLQWHVKRNVIKLDCKLCNPNAPQKSETQAAAA